MGLQVSVEAALPVYRQRCGELHDENLILKARIAELEGELEARPSGAIQQPADGQQEASPYSSGDPV